jgi:hypothetical protein
MHRDILHQERFSRFSFHSSDGSAARSFTFNGSHLFRITERSIQDLAMVLTLFTYHLSGYGTVVRNESKAASFIHTNYDYTQEEWVEGY